MGRASPPRPYRASASAARRRADQSSLVVALGPQPLDVDWRRDAMAFVASSHRVPWIALDRTPVALPLSVEDHLDGLRSRGSPQRSEVGSRRGSSAPWRGRPRGKPLSRVQQEARLKFSARLESTNRTSRDSLAAVGMDTGSRSGCSLPFLSSAPVLGQLRSCAVIVAREGEALL